MPLVVAAGGALVLSSALVVGTVFALLVLFGFVFYGTAVTSVRVDASVYDRQTKAPVSGCLLTFTPGAGSAQSNDGSRTDRAGLLHASATYTRMANAFLVPFQRGRDPDFHCYLGDPRPYARFGEVELWDILLRFRKPLQDAEVKPQIELRRSLGHKELLSPPGQALATATVRIEEDNEGRESFNVPLSLYLDRKEIAACQASTEQWITSGGEDTQANVRAAGLYNDKHYAEALEEYRKASQAWPNALWADDGMADCLEALGRPKEAVEVYRKQVQRAPADPEVRYRLANHLIPINSKEARVQFEALVALEPGNARGFIGLGHALYGLDRYAQAIDAFDKAKRLCATCLDDNDKVIYLESKRLGVGAGGQ
jgi:Flp pilus assembly protein TadD